MDQRTADIAEDVKDIVQTRMAIADKLGHIEQRITHAVEEAKTMAGGVVDQTRESVHHAIGSVRQRLAPAHVASQHPWLMVGGAIVVGCALGFAAKRAGSSGVYAYYPPDASGASVMPPAGEDPDLDPGVVPYYPAHRGTGPARGMATSFINDLTQVWAEELGHLKSEVVRTAQSQLRAWLRGAVPVVAERFGLNMSSDRPRQPEGHRSAP